MVFRSAMHDMIMLEKMWTLNGLADRNGWVLSLSVLHQAHLNRMALLNGNLPPFSKQYVPRSIMENFLPS